MKTPEQQLIEYIGDSKPTLVEFYSPDKSSSMQMNSVIDELRKRIGDKANILQIDGREAPDLMETYKIATYPSYIIFKDGTQAWHDSGRKPVQELEHMLRMFL